MKTITELTHDELLALNDEQIERYVQLEIAEQGIKPVLPPEETTFEKVTITPTEKAYEVCNIIFKDKEQAIKFASQDIYSTDYDYSIGYDYKYLKKTEGLEIKENFYFDRKKVMDLAPLLQSNKIKKEEYDEQKQAYDKFLNSTTEHRELVFDVVAKAKEKERGINNAVKSFEKYKDLAEGNEAIALNFFDKAFTDIDEEIKEIALKRCGVK